MELRQLRAFVAVAEEHSFTGAARRLHLTQQSVSALVRRLESALGTALFARSTRKVELTPAGATLLEPIRHTLAGLDAALFAVGAATPAGPPLRLAFSPAVSFGELDRLLAALGPDRPPTVRELWADEIPEALHDGRFDAALGVALRGAPGITLHPWRRHRVDLLVADGHPFAHRDVVAVGDLDGVTVALTDRGASGGIHDALRAAWATAGAEPAVVTGPRVSGAVPAVVATGAAVTVWLTGMDDRYIPGGVRRVPLVDPETVVTTSLAVLARPPKGGPHPDVARLRDAIEQTRD